MNTRFMCLALSACCLTGCGMERLVGGMAQNYEYQKQIEVHPAYPGLDNRTAAVMVTLDMETQFQNPSLAMTLASNVTRRISENVPGLRVLPPNLISEWQFRTPQWEAMPFSELIENLDVDRIVHIDVTEFRLHPLGNNYLWDGVLSANIGIIERDGLDPDNFVDVFQIDAAFPDMPGITRDSANGRQIETGLLSIFIRDVGWLFYRHLEPKYPDHYDGKITEGRYDG